MTALLCPSCDPTGTGISCAPRRCYCGHSECHAFASYVPLQAPSAHAAESLARQATTTWSDREEGSTWIDQL